MSSSYLKTMHKNRYKKMWDAY